MIDIIIALLIVVILTAIVVTPILMGVMWVPKTKKLRITEKRKGEFTYYRSQLYRPFFGWTGFDCSKYTGEITIFNMWRDNRKYCEDNIEIYKKLKNIK